MKRGFPRIFMREFREISGFRVNPRESVAHEIRVNPRESVAHEIRVNPRESVADEIR